VSLGLGLSPRTAFAQPDPLISNPFGTCTTGNANCVVGGPLCASGTCDPCGQSRYISFGIPDTSAGSNTAIRVKLTSLHDPPPSPFIPPDFDVFEGRHHYLNTIPGTLARCCDPASNPTRCNPSATCTSDADCGGLAPNTKCEKNLCPDSPSFSTYFRCARVGCNPEYRDWSDFSGLITYANGHMIVPSSVFDVAHLADSCAGNEETCAEASAEIQVRTETWGNCDCSNANLTLPSAIDIGRVVSKVQDAAGAFIKPRTQMREAVTNPLGLVNVLDLNHSVESVKTEIRYPFHYECRYPAMPCTISADCSSGNVCSANGFCAPPQRIDPCSGMCQP
jgi:hypothetical protein